MNKPFFSIVVVCLNAQDVIKKTIESVLSQDFDDYEIIVKDGLSKDDTLKNIPCSDKIKVFSQADTSIYDAMNQAIELCGGKFVCFLNCGDCFYDNLVLKRIFDVSEKASEKSVVYGNYSRKGIMFKQPGKLKDFYLYRTPLCHQSMFISKQLFDERGLYSTEYKILADYEHTLGDYFSGADFIYCDYTVCDYMGEGVSESEKGKIARRQERKIIINKYFSEKKQKNYEFILKLSLKGLRQKLISDKSPKLIRWAYRLIINIVNKGGII